MSLTPSSFRLRIKSTERGFVSLYKTWTLFTTRHWRFKICTACRGNDSEWFRWAKYITSACSSVGWSNSPSVSTLDAIHFMAFIASMPLPCPKWFAFIPDHCHKPLCINVHIDTLFSSSSRYLMKWHPKDELPLFVSQGSLRNHLQIQHDARNGGGKAVIPASARTTFMRDVCRSVTTGGKSLSLLSESFYDKEQTRDWQWIMVLGLKEAKNRKCYVVILKFNLFSQRTQDKIFSHRSR